MAFATIVQDGMIRVVELLTILFIGIIAARGARSLIDRAFYEARALHIVRMNVGFMVSRIVEYVLYGATAVVLAQNLGVTKYVLLGLGGIIGIIVVGNLAILVVFAVPNVMARFGSYERHLKVGSRVEREGLCGTVVRKGLMDVMLRSDADELLVVPYRAFESYGHIVQK